MTLIIVLTSVQSLIILIYMGTQLLKYVWQFVQIPTTLISQITYAIFAQQNVPPVHILNYAWLAQLTTISTQEPVSKAALHSQLSPMPIQIGSVELLINVLKATML